MSNVIVKYCLSIFSFTIFLTCASCEDFPQEKVHQKSSNITEWIITDNTPITYSKHAKCRMDCRFIDQEEVKEILMKNNINPEKTRVSHQGESRAYEGVTHDGQKVRIVAALKDGGRIHIVTVIDLKNEWSCSCD